VARQGEHWDPVIEWAAERLGARFILAEGVVHQAQPRTAIDAIAEALRPHATPLGLACLHMMTSLTGSALIAIAFAEKRLSAEQA
jgi:chaperone required for assembly of F1-ATPase